MRTARSIFLAIAAVGFSTAAYAQYRVGPIHPEREDPEFLRRIPQSGYDPFRWNRHTLRWDYVPIPYDPQMPGPTYSPYRFNWHTGRWDYVPQPTREDFDYFREGEVARDFDTRLDLRVSPREHAAPRAAPDAAPALPMTVVPPPENRHLPSTTAPTTAPATTAPTREQSLTSQRLRRLNGRWEFDYSTGRWIYVLPSDE